MTVSLPTCASITVQKCVVGIHYTLEGEQYDDDIIVLDLNDNFDVILEIPKLRRYEPSVRWQHLSVKIFSACSSDGHPVNVLELRQACGGTASECDDLTCGTVVSTTAQSLSVADRYNVEQTPGGCTDLQARPMVHHSNNLSRPEGDMDACLAIDIIGKTNRLSRSGNTVILGRLESRLSRISP